MRRGISLLEVLIAVFVLTFGLMGIAMVIPAGRALTVDAAKSDRSAACGRAVVNDIQIRGWVNTDLWWSQRGALGTSVSRFLWDHDEDGATATPTPALPNYIPWGEVHYLDPLYYANNRSTESARHFPFTKEPYREFTWGAQPRLWPNRALARRSTLYMPRPVLERLTTWADDLVFSAETDGKRPRQMYDWLDDSLTAPTDSYAAPVLPADGFSPTGKTAQYAVNEGNFTWAIMISPAYPLSNLSAWDHDNQDTTPAVPIVHNNNIERYEISVVVYYRRLGTCPKFNEIDTTPVEELPERSCYAKISGGGVGGGDVELFVPNGTPSGWLDVKKNDWLVLRGLDLDRVVSGSGLTPTLQTVCQWYRVVGVDEEQVGTAIADPADLSKTLAGRSRFVTLAGPDWNLNTTNDGALPRFNAETDIAEAAIVDGVVGVHTAFVEAD